MASPLYEIFIIGPHPDPMTTSTFLKIVYPSGSDNNGLKIPPNLISYRGDVESPKGIIVVCAVPSQYTNALLKAVKRGGLNIMDQGLNHCLSLYRKGRFFGPKLYQAFVSVYNAIPVTCITKEDVQRLRDYSRLRLTGDEVYNRWCTTEPRIKEKGGQHKIF